MQAVTFLSSDAELTAADTELFAQPLPLGQNGEECSDSHSQDIAARESLTGRHMVLSNQILWPTNEKSGADLGVSECGQKEVLESETEFADEPESMPEEKVDGPADEEPKKLQDTVEELVYTGDAGEMEAIPQEKSLTPGNEEQENRHGNSNVAQLLSLPEESLATGE